jgi:hypothetical protein
MKYYDSTDKKFVPQTFSPQPFGHYPVPGDPNKVIKNVETGNLQGTLEEMTFLIGIAEKATAASAANSGSIESRKVTLGEVEYALANAQRRIQIQQIFYTESWKRLGEKYVKFLEAAEDQIDSLTVYKKGRTGKKIYKKLIELKDWKDDEGYKVEVKTVTEQQDEQVDHIERLNILKAEMPENVPLTEIYRRKLMELSKLSPEEMSQVEEFEKQRGREDVLEEETLPTPEEGAVVPAQAGAVIPDVPDIAA